MRTKRPLCTILLSPENTSLDSHPKHPLFQILSRFNGIGFVRTKRNHFFFLGGFSQHSSSRSPREGVDTCRDRALNASGRGYHGQAKAGRAAKATRDTSTFETSCPIGMSLPADSSCEGRVSLHFTQSGLLLPAAAGVVDEKGS